jgi:hypothetical protein
MESSRRSPDPAVLRAAASPDSAAGDLLEQKRMLSLQFVPGDSRKIRRTTDARQNLRQMDAAFRHCIRLGDHEEPITRP